MTKKVYNKKLKYIEIECPQKCTLSWLKENCKKVIYCNANSRSIRWSRVMQYEGNYFVQRCYCVTVPLASSKYKPAFRRTDYMKLDGV